MTKRVAFATDWSAARLPIRLGSEEAVFWLHAMQSGARAELQALDVGRVPSLDEVMRCLATMRPYGESHREAVLPLAALIDPPALLGIILDEANDDAAAGALRREAERMGALGSYGTISVATIVLDSEQLDDPDDAVAMLKDVAASMKVGPRLQPALVAAHITERISTPSPFAVLLGGGRGGEGTAAIHRAILHRSLAAGFGDFIAPYLGDDAFEAARVHVRGAVERALRRPPAPIVHPFVNALPFAFFLAASLHLTDEVEAIVARLDPSAGSQPFVRSILLGLRTPAEIAAAGRRMSIVLSDPTVLREWLATTGDDGLDYACEQIAEHATEANADAIVAAVADVESDRVAPALLRLCATPVLYVSARSWVESNLDQALPTLAAGADGTSFIAETSREILRRFARRGHPGAATALRGESKRDRR